MESLIVDKKNEIAKLEIIFDNNPNKKTAKILAQKRVELNVLEKDFTRTPEWRKIENKRQNVIFQALKEDSTYIYTEKEKSFSEKVR